MTTPPAFTRRPNIILSCSRCPLTVTLSLREHDERPQHRCVDRRVVPFDQEREKNPVVAPPEQQAS